MRLGTVIGRITLTQKEPVYEGGRLLIVQPWLREQFQGAPVPPLPKGFSLVVYDELGADDGATIGFTEGSEASMPFPVPAPVDAYCACIVDYISYTPVRRTAAP